MDTLLWIVGIAAIVFLVGWYGLRHYFPPDTQ
jgi:hypothetical protein